MSISIKYKIKEHYELLSPHKLRVLETNLFVFYNNYCTIFKLLQYEIAIKSIHLLKYRIETFSSNINKDYIYYYYNS